jgi:hypothetical protein
VKLGCPTSALGRVWIDRWRDGVLLADLSVLVFDLEFTAALVHQIPPRSVGSLLLRVVNAGSSLATIFLVCPRAISALRNRPSTFGHGALLSSKKVRVNFNP